MHVYTYSLESLRPYTSVPSLSSGPDLGFYVYGTGDETYTFRVLGKCSINELRFVNFSSCFTEIYQRLEPFHLLVNLYSRVQKILDIQLKMGKCKMGNRSLE